ncbi:aminotransferase class I/II-fold pyridoxal phosphate-dependent enzyme [Candidatus Galacturonibacter soehngenii]|nr:aminotransferase class I/II-fold pyridoxal phosphate-dependent enzyme [Candidatus Galacturonibacter soehngenii]
MNLYERLKSYSELDYYPFHMPGHKRSKENHFINPFCLDITEIDNFDNLHHSEGILLEAQKRAAHLYQSKESYFIINGSTAGLLSAISACTSKGGSILMARNCHKAVYNAVFLNELKNIYTYPQNTDKYCVNGGLNPEKVKQLLISNQNIQAVVITSPTYDGIVSNVKEIANIVHKYNIPLIVDEAHGAHFGFHSYFPENAIKNGADIVIHSLHKTLPSLTQTALIHVNGTIVDRDRLRRYLSIYQTSSPSYLLMASIDSCINLLQTEGKDLFDNYVKKLNQFREEMSVLTKLKLLDDSVLGKYDIYDLDRSKLIISTKNTDITGKELYNRLLEKYHLQMEMATSNYVLGMTSVMDTEIGYERLKSALIEIDKTCNYVENNEKINLNLEAKICYTITESLKRTTKEHSLNDSIGKVSGEYVYLYPPGIPLIAPGEEITYELIIEINKYKKMGLTIEGMKDITNNKIQILT